MTFRTAYIPNPRRSVAAVIVAIGLLTAGCGSLLQQAPPPNVYVLTPKSTFAADLPIVQWQLLIEEPNAAAEIDTNRIVFRPSPTEIQYYARSRWADRAPVMVQRLLLESFDNSRKILGVDSDALGFNSDYTLRLDIREFGAEAGAGGSPPMVRVRVIARIVDAVDEEIIGVRNFEASRPASSTSVPDVVLAFDDALGRVLKDTVEWSLRHTETFHRFAAQPEIDREGS